MMNAFARRQINPAAELERLGASPALSHLDDLLEEFNIFEAIGMVHQEIRHSAFLGFLLSPNGSHGLKDQALKIVMEAAGEDRGTLGHLDLNDTEVTREWNGIDILAINAKHRIAVLIENKIFAAEQPGQLSKYRSFVESTYPNHQIMCVFLSPNGSKASHLDFRSVSYSQLCRSLEHVIDAAQPPIRAIVRETIEHYVRMLKRHVMEDGEIPGLCAKIYREHKAAIDLIIRHVPVQDVQLRDRAVGLIQDTEGIIVNHICEDEEHKWVGFLPESWDRLQHEGFLHTIQHDKYCKTGRPLFFQFEIDDSHVQLTVQLRYGTPEERQKLVAIALANSPPLTQYKPAWGCTDLYRQTVFGKGELSGEALDTLLSGLEAWWVGFAATTLREIEEIFVRGIQEENIL